MWIEYDIDLYSSDGSHPSFLGSYVAGVCFYTAIFQKDPLNIPWNEEWDIVLSEADSEIIHEVVKIVVYNNLDDWNITDGDDNCNGVSIDESSILKNLITIIDMLGRETTNKGFQLHIYDDGSVEKKYLIK